MVNEYGLDASYFEKKLALIARDLDRYTPDEIARELLRLVGVASPITLTEKEFSDMRLRAIHDRVNATAVLPNHKE